MKKTQKKATQRGKKVTVAVSGGFDPIHIGHVRYINEAKKLGDRLVVILNNDHWLLEKKGFVFMSQSDRKEILESLRAVDKVVFTGHKKHDPDRSVCRELEVLLPDIFANGGDRTLANIPEIPLCKKIGCKMVFGIGKGGKVRSSSKLVGRFMRDKAKREITKWPRSSR